MKFKFVFCFEQIKTIQTKKTPTFLEAIPVNNADNVLLQDDTIF